MGRRVCRGLWRGARASARAQRPRHDAAFGRNKGFHWQGAGGARAGLIWDQCPTTNAAMMERPIAGQSPEGVGPRILYHTRTALCTRNPTNSLRFLIDL